MLNILDGNTTGIINASTVLTLKGNTSALINTYSSTEIIGLGNEAVKVNSGEISVSSANILSEASTGKVTATISDGDMAKLLSLNGNNNAYTITISDASAEASKPIELYEKTTAKINASKLRTINGNSSDLNTVYSLSGIIGLGNETINISDTSIDASLLNILDGNTTGKINASTVTKLTGSESEINAAISSNGISDGESESPLWLSYFESLEYLASNQDLINTFGLNSNNAKLHYINYGRAEGRN